MLGYFKCYGSSVLLKWQVSVQDVYAKRTQLNFSLYFEQSS
jgi:hypothetical protein